MKHLKRKRNFLFSLCGITIASVLITVACHKGIETPTVIKFDKYAAKEWYYGVFKKSAEWNSYNAATNGIKSPDWKHSTYQRIGNMEIVEFPLIKVKSSIFIPSDDSRSAADNKRLVESALARIVFIKSGSKITVRQVDYIPDAAYALKKGYDISNNTVGNFDPDFSGRLIIGKWNGTELSRRLVVNGKITKTGKLKSTAVGQINNSQQRETTNSQNCVTYLITEYWQECEYQWVGDNLEKVCSAWEPTGNAWYETYCEGNDNDCTGLTDEQCACALYGDCGGGGEEQDATCDELANGSWETEDVSEFQGSEVSGETVVNGIEKRTKIYKWIFSRNSWLWYHWHYTSFETATQEKPATDWLFVTFDHTSISRDGTIPGEADCTIITAVPEIFSHRRGTMMDLNYKNHFKLMCKGVKLYEGDQTSNAYRFFSADE